jgi:hypothetical protein
MDLMPYLLFFPVGDPYESGKIAGCGAYVDLGFTPGPTKFVLKIK